MKVMEDCLWSTIFWWRQKLNYYLIFLGPVCQSPIFKWRANWFFTSSNLMIFWTTHIQKTLFWRWSVFIPNMLSGKLFQKVRPSICQIGAGGLNWYTRPWHCLFLTDELAPLEISLNIIISRNDIICQHQFVSYCNTYLEFNFRFSISW